MFFKKNTRLPHQKTSYAQCGEDLIMDFVLQQLKLAQPSYIDIGAHHPYYLSNTAYFYERGWKGISIEPDPQLFAEIKKERPNEICLNIGVGETSGGHADFYVMNVPSLNTMSKSEAERYASYPGKSISQVIQIPILSVNDVIVKHLNGKAPNMISLDVEGMDLAIIKSLDLKKYRPEVLCIETLSYTENNTEEKQQDIIDYVKSQGYFLYADTYINSIFVEQAKWKAR